MARELTVDDYFKAAKLVANCPRDRVPYVLQILAKAEIDVEQLDTIIEEAKTERKRHLYCKRTNEDTREKWRLTDNETTMILRKAYNLNIGFSAIKNLTGIDRTSLYKYLWAERVPSPKKAEKIAEVVGKMIAEVSGEQV